MKYRAEVDGLRAVSVLGVVLFHSKISFGGVPILSAGFLGVDVFFVISGYLISRILIEGFYNEEENLIASFYVRRFNRIYPAFLCMLSVSSILAWFYLLPHQYLSFIESSLSSVFFVSNIYFWRESGYFSEINSLSPLLHTWTLGVEEQYYLIFPLLLVFVLKFFNKCFFYFILFAYLSSFLLCFWAFAQGYQAAAFYLLPTRVWEFFAGVWVASTELNDSNPSRARYSENPVAAPLGLAMIVASFVIFDEQVMHPGWGTVLPVLGAVLVLKFGSVPNVGSVILSWSPLVRLGLISYSIYLWHQPLFAFARSYSINELTNPMRALLIAFCIALAYVSWKYVETPCRKTGLFYSGARTTAATLALVAIALSASYGIFTKGAPARMEGLPEIALYVDNYASGFLVDGRDCYLNNCKLGNPDAPVELIIKGDSHAGVLAASFGQMLRQKGVAAQILANAGPYIGNNKFPDFFGGGHRYNPYVEDHDVQLLSPKIEYVVIASRWSSFLSGHGFDNGEGGKDYMDEWRPLDASQRQFVSNLLLHGINKLLDANKRVVLIYPIPEVGWKVPETVVKRLRRGEVEPLTTSYQAYKERNKVITEILDGLGESPNLLRVYPSDLFCNLLEENRCITHNNNDLLYFDSDHLSKAGADIVVAEILHQMGNKWGW